MDNVTSNLAWSGCCEGHDPQASAWIGEWPTIFGEANAEYRLTALYERKRRRVGQQEAHGSLARVNHKGEVRTGSIEE